MIRVAIPTRTENFTRIRENTAMYSEDYELDTNVECTGEAYGKYGDGFTRSLAFHTPLLDKEEALECIREIPKYNAFNPKKVAEQLGKLEEVTGGEMKISVGREGSPVLYIWTDRKERVIELFKELKNMKETPKDWTGGPNEFSEVENRRFSKFKVPENNGTNKELIRAWWD